MRIISALLLMASASALTACAGGDGGLSSAGVLAQSNGIECTIPNNNCAAQPTGGGAPAPGGTPAVVPGSASGGNNTETTTGNKTITLKKFVLDPADPGKIAVAQISSSSAGDYAATEAALLAKTPPPSLKFKVNTNNPGNSSWAVPEEMAEFDIGTRELTWIRFNHTDVDFSNPANYNVQDPDGNKLYYDPAKNAFVYAVDTITSNGPVSAGDKVNHREDHYWNQIKGYMGSKANGGAMDNYVEYRNYKSDPTNTRRELIQLWNWKKSYVTNYENQIGGGAPMQQAWSFGGKEATNVGNTDKAKYVGRFVGNALVKGFVKDEGAEIDPNGNWILQGRSDTTIDFNTSNMDVDTTISPETWSSYQQASNGKYLYTWTNGIATDHDANNIAGTPSVGTVLRPNYDAIYGTKIKLNGKLVAADATSATPGVRNVIADGTATLVGDYTSSDQVMHGGLFGTNGEEVTAIFSVTGEYNDPTGGSHPITDPTGASVTISGAINGQCVPGAGLVCAPTP